MRGKERIHKMRDSNKYYGYTVLEIMGVLVTLCFVILLTNQFIKAQQQAREINQIADQAKSYSQIAIKYIEDNYRGLVQQSYSQQDIIIPFSVFAEYTPEGVTLITKNYQTPCLYLSNGQNTTLRAYIIFGNADIKSQSLDKLTIDKIAKTIGENAGSLVKQGNDSYILSGGIESGISFDDFTINNIVVACNFTPPLPANALAVDLTKGIKLFASIKGALDQQSTTTDSDPSLKKVSSILESNPSINSLTTMQTNLYLDNIVKESTTSKSYYCDATQLPIIDANAICLDYAAIQGISMYAGTAAWISSVLDSTGQNCIATANAHFYTSSIVATCNGVIFPSANSFCPASLNGQSLVSGSAYWSPMPGILSGSQCISNAYATYQTPGNCNYACLTNTAAGMYVDQPCSLFNGDCSGRGYAINITSVYDSSTNTCIMTAQCSGGGGTGSKSEPPLSSGSSSIQSCGQKSMPAVTVSTTVDLGYKNC